MAAGTITNPTGALGSTVGSEANFAIETPVKNTGAQPILRGQRVALKAVVNNGVMEVARGEVADNARITYGIASENIPVGEVGNVVTYGFAYALVEAAPTNAAALGTAAANGGATAGRSNSITAATAGTHHGVFLGAVDANGFAPIWVYKF